MREDPWVWRLVILALVLALLCGSTGCFTRTVYVPAGKAVRLRQDVRAKVWVMDADGKPVPGEMVLHEGWYCLPAMPEVTSRQKL